MTAQWRTICPKPNLGPEQLVAEVGRRRAVHRHRHRVQTLRQGLCGETADPRFPLVLQLARQKAVDRIWQVAQQIPRYAISGLDPRTLLVFSSYLERAGNCRNCRNKTCLSALVPQAP